MMLNEPMLNKSKKTTKMQLTQKVPFASNR